MKFKTASVLELIVPSSILMLLLLSACGGGGSPYGTTRAFDGLWNASFVLDPPAKGGASEVVCAGTNFVDLTIAHGFGHATPTRDCEYGYLDPTGWATYSISLDVSITFGSNAESAVIAVDVNGGAVLNGTCDTPNSCRAPGFYMYR